MDLCVLCLFQSAVESIAMMNAKERTKMFERISNSFELANEYDTKLAALQKAKEDTQYHFSRKRTAAAEKKQVFKDKTEVLWWIIICSKFLIRMQVGLLLLWHAVISSGREISGTGGAAQWKQAAAQPFPALSQREGC